MLVPNPLLQLLVGVSLHPITCPTREAHHCKATLLYLPHIHSAITWLRHLVKSHIRWHHEGHHPLSCLLLVHVDWCRHRYLLLLAVGASDELEQLAETIISASSVYCLDDGHFGVVSNLKVTVLVDDCVGGRLVGRPACAPVGYYDAGQKSYTDNCADRYSCYFCSHTSIFFTK